MIQFRWFLCTLTLWLLKEPVWADRRGKRESINTRHAGVTLLKTVMVSSRQFLSAPLLPTKLFMLG